MDNPNENEGASTPEDALATVEASAEPTPTYEELLPHEEIVVKIGPRMQQVGRKSVEVEPEKEIVMTKAGFESLERDDDGELVHVDAVPVGIPVYSRVKDRRSPSGYRTELKTALFEEVEVATTKEAAKSTSEDKDSAPKPNTRSRSAKPATENK
ncbi:hypothetical protein [Tellurirhabdus bombi]|uniref:hypothetical protein n=1 Tax=Tellurirhabdus bombi TaxID=2907205 RepID=UPI001F393E0F|nr:hypothetical protein [Tellurirhabdus bombi]